MIKESIASLKENHKTINDAQSTFDGFAFTGEWAQHKIQSEQTNINNKINFQINILESLIEYYKGQKF